MKKTVSFLSIIFAFLLAGCSSSSSRSQPETLQDWSIQYNEGTNDYSVFFGLTNKDGQYLSADVHVKIRIENESNEIVYSSENTVASEAFNFYTSNAFGERYLAEIRVPESSITAGKSSSGKMYLTVYNDDFSFSEVNYSILYGLPILDTSLTADTLPMDINIKDYLNESVVSTLRIEQVDYTYETLISCLEITVSGTKTYATEDSSLYYSDSFRYKISDSNGYVVDTGTIYLDSLSQGDKFKDDSIYFYDAVPGEKYTITFHENDY